MKVRYNFIIAIAAVMMLLLPSANFFAEPSCVPKMTQSISDRKYRKAVKKISKLVRNTPERKLEPIVYELEYEKYSIDYLLKLAKEGKRITAIDNYKEIKNIRIPRNTKVPTLPKNINDIPKYFFANCSKLKSFCIPDNIKKIETGAFWLNMELEEVTIPGSVKSIEKGAFYYCTSLKKVKLEEGLKSIGNKAFERCEYLEEIEIPSTVESIGDNAFYGCKRLEKLILKNGLKSIGDHAFDSVKLEEIVIPSTIEYVGCGQWNCKKLVLMDGIERLHKYMTGPCYDLEEIELPCSIKYIDDNTFNYFENLKNINFPKSLIIIGKASFEDCLSLKKVVIPDSVIEIGERAFAGCDNLERVKIPKRFEERLGDIFDNCKNLKEITLYDKNNIETQIPVEKVNDIIKVKVPKSYNVNDSFMDFSKYIVDTPTNEDTSFMNDINNLMAEMIEY